MPTCIPLSGCGFRVGTARRGMSTGGERSMPVLATTCRMSDDDTKEKFVHHEGFNGSPARASCEARCAVRSYN